MATHLRVAFGVEHSEHGSTVVNPVRLYAAHVVQQRFVVLHVDFGIIAGGFPHIAAENIVAFALVNIRERRSQHSVYSSDVDSHGMDLICR